MTTKQAQIYAREGQDLGDLRSRELQAVCEGWQERVEALSAMYRLCKAAGLADEAERARTLGLQMIAERYG